MANRWAHARRDTPAAQARRRKYASREHRQAAATYKQRQQRGEWLTCWRGQHLIPPTVRCHVGHDDVNVDLIRGPECPDCNLKAAARKGNRVARARTATVRPVRRRDWYGNDLTFGECVVCGATFAYSHADQKTCSRTCGMIHRYGRGPICSVTYADCLQCGRCFVKHGQRGYCSDDCRTKSTGHIPWGSEDTGVCVGCGITFARTRRGRPVKRCDPCRLEARRQARRDAKANMDPDRRRQLKRAENQRRAERRRGMAPQNSGDAA